MTSQSAHDRRSTHGRLAIFAAALVIAGCAAPGASQSQPPSNFGTVPGSTPTSSATPAVESAGPSSPPGSLRVEGFASVVVEKLNMRLGPDLDAAVVEAVYPACPSPCGPLQVGADTSYREVYLLDGPVVADGFAWYLAATVTDTALFPEYVGWVAAGDETTAWLLPREADCPSAPIELGDLTYASLSRFDAIACFGGRELTVRGWYVALPANAEPPGVCTAEPAWLVCGWGYHMLRLQPSGWYGDANYLPMKVDPASNVQMPPRGNWVLLTGMFDHPRAQACGSDTEADAVFRLTCRMEFVVTSAQLAE